MKILLAMYLKDIIVQYLHMDRQALEKHSRYLEKEINTVK